MSKAQTLQVAETEVEEAKEEFTTILTVTSLMAISNKELSEIMDVATLTEPQ